MRTPQNRFVTACIGTVTGLSALLFSPIAGAQSDAMLRCPKLADRDARLACYDAILPPVATSAPTSAPATTAAAPLAATPAPPAPAQPAARDSAQAFGLVDRTRAGEVQSIETEVAPGFYGWGPGERIRLVNKQVWRVEDSSSGSIDPSKRKVIVKRGVLGSFFLEFEGLTKSPRVVRVE